MFRIFLTNLGKYNEGELVGEWVDLPCYELDDVLERIGISPLPDEKGRYYEEYFITDYENDFGIAVGEYMPLSQLNELAEAVDGADPDIMAALVAHETEWQEAVRIYEDGEYLIWEDCSSMAEVAERMADETGELRQWERAGFPVQYIDWEMWGRDLDIEGVFLAYGESWRSHYGYIELL